MPPLMNRSFRVLQRSIYDELRRVPAESDTDKLRQIADEILGLRLKDVVVLQKKLDADLKEESLRLPLPQGRTTFPHPSLFFRSFC